ncbi:TetR family transcriptional regulator [Xylophilus sp. Kf1]|nr:TetR family transcriptional regulator [Xylophilus sp. Kf1]
MPRVSRLQAERNRESIKLAAARLYRERGFDGVGISEITRAAGLTHGSFYGHFASKEALAAEALDACMQSGLQRWDQRAAQAGRDGMIRGYLSARNRDLPGDACHIAALAGDMARQPVEAATHASFNQTITALLDKLSAVQPPGAADAVEQQSLTDLATLVGALILSRATAGSALSDDFLDLVATELIDRGPVGSAVEPDDDRA